MNKKIITVYSPFSCGATDIAVKVTTDLAHKSKRVCLLDFNILKPRVRERLGIKESKGILEMIDLVRQNKLHDENFLRIFEKKKGFFVLTGLYELNEIYNMRDYQEFLLLLEKFKQYFEYIVIDVNAFHDLIPTDVALSSADDILVVTHADLVTLQETKRYLRMFSRHNDYDKHKMKLILNNYGREDDLLKEEVGSLFKKLPLFYLHKASKLFKKKKNIPNDYMHLLESFRNEKKDEYHLTFSEGIDMANGMPVINRLNKRGGIQKHQVTKAEETTQNVLAIVEEIIDVISKNEVVIEKISERDREYVKTEINRTITDHNFVLPGHSREELVKHVYDFMFNYSIIQKYVEMPDCNNILINSYNNIWVWIKDKRIQTDLSFGSEKYLMTFIYAIRAKLGGTLNQNKSLNVFNDPNYRLRIAIGIRPLATGSPTLTIRKQPEKNLRMSDLIDLSMLSKYQSKYLISKVNEGKSIVFCGKGGSGKTMLMRAVIEEIARDQRIFIMEENTELRVEHPGALSYEVRRDRGISYGVEEYSDFGLMNSIDWYVFGEIRSKEALAFFNGAFSGNSTLTTTHSLSKEDALDKLMINMEKSGTNIPTDVLREILYKSVHVIVFLRDFKIASISEIEEKEIIEISLENDIGEAEYSEYSV